MAISDITSQYIQASNRNKYAMEIAKSKYSNGLLICLLSLNMTCYAMTSKLDLFCPARGYNFCL